MRADAIVSSLIGSIYDAAIDADRWRSITRAMREAFRADVVVFWRRAPETARAGVVTCAGPCSERDHGSPTVHASCWSRIRAEQPVAVGEMEEIATLLPIGEPVFREMSEAWCSEHDLEHAVVVSVLREPDHVSSIELVRARGGEPFGRSEAELAHDIVPHLARALAIEREREQSRVRSAAAAALGERLPVGVVLVEPSGRVIDSSRRAKAILEERDGLCVDEGFLRATTRAETTKLRRAIEMALLDPERESPRNGPPLTIERSPGRSALEVEIARVSGTGAGALVNESQALVYVRDPDRGSGLSAQALRRLYGLTRCEATVTALIARGMNHADVARELGVSVCAVRFHLKSIYAKTATQRQAELVYLLATGSAQLTA